MELNTAISTLPSFLDRGGDVNLAMKEAIDWGQARIAELCIARGAKIYNRYLWFAYNWGYVELVKLMR